MSFPRQKIWWITTVMEISWLAAGQSRTFKEVSGCWLSSKTRDARLKFFINWLKLWRISESKRGLEEKRKITELRILELFANIFHGRTFTLIKFSSESLILSKWVLITITYTHTCLERFEKSFLCRVVFEIPNTFKNEFPQE